MNLRFKYESEIKKANLKLENESQIDLGFDGGSLVALAPVEVLGLLCGSPMLAPGAVLPEALWGVVACGQRVWLSCAAWASVSVLAYCAAYALCALSWSVCGRVQRAAGHNRSPRAHSCWLCAHKIQAEVARLCARLLLGCGEPGFTSC